MDDALRTSVERTILAWPGVTKETRSTELTPGIDVTIYRVGRRQLGHIHHDGVADLLVSKTVHDELIAAGRALPHRGGFASVVSFELRETADVADLVALFRLIYDRVQETATARTRQGATPAPRGRSA